MEIAKTLNNVSDLKNCMIQAAGKMSNNVET